MYVHLLSVVCYFSLGVCLCVSLSVCLSMCLCVCIYMCFCLSGCLSVCLYHSTYGLAYGVKVVFIGRLYVTFNVCTVARGTMDTRIPLRRKLYTKINSCPAMLNVINRMNS